MANRVSNRAQQLAGRVKEAGGKATADRSLETRGKADQLKAESKQAGTNLRKTARKAKSILAR